MAYDGLRFIGEPVIEESKREEFNELVLKLLHLGGIRRTETVTVSGKEFEVISPVRPDQKGIVEFDYSIFEKIKKDTARYDMNTGRLDVTEKSGMEFDLVMSMIKVAAEAYSEDLCLMIDSDGLAYVGAYASLIYTMTGTFLDFRSRSRYWDALLFLRKNGIVLSYSELRDKVPKLFALVDFDHLLATDGIEDNRIDGASSEFHGPREEIPNTGIWALRPYAFRLMKEMISRGKQTELKQFLKKLLDAECLERKKLMKDETFGILADISLYVLPSVLVLAYAAAMDRDFWSVWDELELKGYSDLDIDPDKHRYRLYSEEYVNKFYLYEAMRRKNEDEFLEYWTGNNLKLSEGMHHVIRCWQENMEKICPPENFDMQVYMFTYIEAYYSSKGNRLLDKRFVEDFLEHGDEKLYQKAMMLLHEYMFEGLDLMPEMTREEALSLIIAFASRKETIETINAFESLMLNRTMRTETFGF